MNNHKPNTTSGYESDVISEFAESDFNDVLETTFSDTVLLYNSDMTECQEIQCVIQGNSADTQLKSMERVGLFPIGTVKTGMYVYFNNLYWLVTGCPSSNKVYEKVVLDICQHKLRWQNANGEIIERWGNFTSASKYDDGLEDDKTVLLSSDNLNILIPYDKEGLGLEYKRVFIDSRPIPQKTYVISRVDDVLYNFGEHGGILSFIADKTELNVDTDNRELGICDYIPSTTPSSGDETTDLTANIEGNTNLKVGFARTYAAIITDKDNNLIEWSEDYCWNVCSLINISVNTLGNKIKILVEDDDLVDEKFKLQVLKGSDVIGEVVVTIVGMI